MSYIKRLLELEYPNGIIPRWGSTQNERYLAMLQDRQFARHGSTQAREAHKVATREKVKGMTDEMIQADLFG